MSIQPKYGGSGMQFSQLVQVGNRFYVVVRPA